MSASDPSRVVETRNIPIGWNDACPLRAVTRTDPIPVPLRRNADLEGVASRVTILDTNGAPLCEIALVFRDGYPVCELTPTPNVNLREYDPS